MPKHPWTFYYMPLDEAEPVMWDPVQVVQEVAKRLVQMSPPWGSTFDLGPKIWARPLGQNTLGPSIIVLTKAKKLAETRKNWGSSN